MKAYGSYTIVDVIDGLLWKGSSATAPSNPQLGWAYYNTKDHTSYLYDGSNWQPFVYDGQEGGPGASIVDTIPQYCIWSSATTLPDSSVTWSDQFPSDWTGKDSGENPTYIWQRTKTTLSDGTEKLSETPQLINQYQAATIAAQLNNKSISEWCLANHMTLIDGSTIVAGSVDTVQLNAQAVTAEKIASKTITADQIATQGINAENIDTTGLHAEYIVVKDSNNKTLFYADGRVDRSSDVPSDVPAGARVYAQTLSAITSDMGVLNAGEIRNKNYNADSTEIKKWTGNLPSTGSASTTTSTGLVYTPSGDLTSASVHWDGTTTYENFDAVVIESSYEFVGYNLPVTTIDDNGFKNCTTLKRLILPDSVTFINSKAFAGCTELTEMAVPDSVVGISSGAFSGCSKLQSLTLPHVGYTKTSTTDKTLFGYIFGTTEPSDSSNFTATTQKYSFPSSSSATYYIPNSLTSVTVTGGKLSYGAFYNCKSLQTVVLGSGVESVGEYAFYKCAGLKSVSIPDNIDTIDANAFQNCTSLTNMVFPASLIEIGASAFSGCTNLQNFYFPANKITAGSDAFYYTSRNSPANVYITDIQAWCGSVMHKESGDPALPQYDLYLNGRKLTDLVYPNNTSYIPPFSFYHCASLESVEIPDTVVEIGSNSFAICSNLKRVAIGNGVTAIRASCFSNCNNLSDIVLGKNLTYISNNAFNKKSAGTSHNFYYLGTANQWESRVTVGSSVSDIDTNLYFYTDHKQDSLRTLEGKYWTYSNDNNFILSCDDGTIKSRYFKLNSDGTLNAENVNIRGAIAATTISSVGVVDNTTSKAKSTIKSLQIENGELVARSGVAETVRAVNPIGKIYADIDSSGYKPRFIIENVSSNDGYFKGNWQFNGTVKDSSGGVISSSDANAKNSIQAQPEAYSEIFNRLNPVIYKYNNGSSDRYHTGLIAQEVEQAVIDSGMTMQDFAAVCFEADEDGTKKNYGIRYGELVSMCIYEIQRLKKRVDELEKELQERSESQP